MSWARVTIRLHQVLRASLRGTLPAEGPDRGRARGEEPEGARCLRLQLWGSRSRVLEWLHGHVA